MKKRLFKNFTAVLVSVLACLLLMAESVSAADTDQPYSFNYDDFRNAMPAPDPYEVRYDIDVNSILGVGRLSGAQGLFVQGNQAYIVDTGNNRILVINLSENGYSLERIITEAGGFLLNAPRDVFVTEDGKLYIADTGNHHVLVVDSDLNLLFEAVKPTSTSFDQAMDFKPEKLIVTAGGRIFVQADAVNRGLMEFSEEGDFIGYMGSSPVTFDIIDYFWKLVSTEAQKEQLASFVPTEYNNVAIGPDGFLFVTTDTFTTGDLWNGDANPVRRLNYNGSDIMIRTDKVIGALNWNSDSDCSRFADVTVLNNDVFYCLDKTLCYIYAYDGQGQSLYVFGGAGNRKGYFQSPVALEHWNNDLLVLDEKSGFVTVLKLTDYGQAYSDAVTQYDSGHYEESMEAWQEVLRRNGNCILAYDGIGKILLRNGDYEEALEYLRYAKDRYYYSKAWQLYRKDWIEKNLIYFLIGLLVLIAVILVIRIIKKIRRDMAAYEDEREKIRIRNRNQV